VNSILYVQSRILLDVGKNKIDAAAARQDDQNKMSFNSSSVVELRFIHQAPTTAKDDELVRISPFESEDGSTKYAWRYIYNSSTSNVSILESRSQVRAQLRNLTALLAWDSDPYATVQLLLPTMPSVLFTAEDFPEAIEQVIDSIMEAFRGWPIKVDAKAASAVCQASMPAPQEFVDRLEAAAESAAEAREAAAEAEAAAAAANNCCGKKTSCTRSGRAYTPIRSTPARACVEEDDEESCGPPPPLVRLSSKYDLGDGRDRYDNGYGSYYSNDGRNVRKNLFNPEEDCWEA
jgi:hypothetical protein